MSQIARKNRINNSGSISSLNRETGPGLSRPSNESVAPEKSLLDACDRPANQKPDQQDVSFEDYGGDTQRDALDYVDPELSDLPHMQVLGPAGREQIAKLNELEISSQYQNRDDSLQSNDLNNLEMKAIDPDHDQNRMPVLPDIFQTSFTGLAQQLLDSRQPQLQESREAKESGSSDVAKASLTVEKLPADFPVDITENDLLQWAGHNHSSGSTEVAWRLYQKLTENLSNELCEQLRLILEPTMATRLKGDFRTGKRLNMKKIIPYIASDYTKDKIWLRRTRPSEREYQVLIALDDSRSMADSHSVHLAFETLALVSKALTRLEVGDIAIAKFGESVEVIHDFNNGSFSDDDGTEILDAFQFKQNATDVLSLIETSIAYLSDARESRTTRSSSTAELWQLEIIISDGICQDHDSLRAALTRAAEQRLLIVFIVLDALQRPGENVDSDASNSGSTRTSILEMNQVQYENVNGKMDLQIRRYLDSFPFEYFTVLRRVESLPEVLSGILKQFFESISKV